MMNIRCNQVQDALAANCEMQEDTDVDLASAVQAHLSECENCSEIEAALSTLDDQFLAMPEVEPADALVAQLLSAVQVDIKPSALQVVRESPEFLVDSDNMAKNPSRPRWGSAVGIGGMLAAAAGIALVATSTWPGISSDSKARKEAITLSALNSRESDEYRGRSEKPSDSPPTETDNWGWGGRDSSSVVSSLDGVKDPPSPDETSNTRTPIDANTRRQLESLGYFGGDELGFDSTVNDPNAGDSVGTKLAADSFHYKQEIAKPIFEFAQDSGQVRGKYDSDRQVAEKKVRELARNSGILGVFSFDNSEVKQNAQHETAESKEELFDDIANLERDEVDRLSTTTGLFWGAKDSDRTKKEPTVNGAFASLTGNANFSAGLDGERVYRGLRGDEEERMRDGWGKDSGRYGPAGKGSSENQSTRTTGFVEDDKRVPSSNGKGRKGKDGKRDKEVSFSGSSSLESVFVVDGVNTTGRKFPISSSSEDNEKLYQGYGDQGVDQNGVTNKPAVSGKRGQRLSEELEITESEDEAKALRDVAQAFLAEKEDVSAATIVSDGFWSNNYIPDSPGLRLLASRLASDPNEAEFGSLDSDFSPYEPKLDAPRNSALGISVRSDQRVTNGPTRMLLQVGIQGTAKKPGRRAALNIAVVLDLAGHTSSKQVQESMSKLLRSLRSAKQSGDRFSLTIANAPGGLLLTAKQFRSGPLTVAMRDLFSGGVSEERAEQPTLGLNEAVLQATTQVTLNDDPSAPLGRSSVLLVTAAVASSVDHQGLMQLAQANTIKGIGFSVIGIGQAIDDTQLTALARAGHGHRRLVLQATKASSVIADTLADAESVVARALRVRIKLAPGVKLVEVVGSKRLGADAARRTRAAEQSIDKRIDRAQGIVSDREQDEEGIKIIIPSFSAGESHVILLDVIVPGPGAVADVSVSYKDLVHLRNGKSRTSLSVGRGTKASGPDQLGILERDVFRNYVGLEVAQELKAAGRLLGTGNGPAAHAVLIKLHDLLLGLRSEYSWLQRDTVFARDLRAVQHFRELLSTLDSASTSSKNYIALSLNYSGWRKIVQAPAVNNTTR